MRAQDAFGPSRIEANDVGVAEPEATRLAALEQELQDFSYIVSHDLAASFRQMRGFIGLLARETGGQWSDSQHTYAERIEKTAAKCETMLEQLLIYSRAQQAELVLRDWDATLLLERARQQLGGPILETKAEVDIPALGPIRVDGELMTRAFRELLDNAIKFHRPGVPPRVAVERVPTPDRWLVRIRDNGQGVSSENSEIFFRMFYRAEPDDPRPGIGAGLPIARRILRRHGGDVQLVDWSGGACVEISLPAAP